MMLFLKLIRWPNLLIIFISILLIQFCIINPILGTSWVDGGLITLEFTLLILATLFITVGGYLINDVFDIEVDRYNNPGKNQVGMKFRVFNIQVLYWIFTICGVLFGLTLSWMVDRINYSLIFVFTAGLLWFYSERYQCIPLVGNLVIAFLSALSFGIVWLFEFIALSNDAITFTAVQASFPLVNRFVLIYMSFAFLVSLLREIVKDQEDKKGDERFGCKTFVVAYGEQKTKTLATVITILGLVGAIWVQIFFYSAGFMKLFAWFFIIDAYFIFIMFAIIRAHETNHFAKLSFHLKILMLTGILSMALVYFEV